MPELPEVETVVRGLRAAVLGRRIEAVRLGKTDFIENPAELEAFLPGCRIRGVERYGKFIVLTLERAGLRNNCRLLVHLGMTGQLQARRAADPVAPHTHVFLALDDGRELRYTDIRRFGRIRLLAARNAGLRPASSVSDLPSLGLDPLEITEAEFARTLGARRAMVKALLLDQHVLRGIGNIYADESLWRARIHPARHAAQLTRREIATLRQSIRRILQHAIRLGGSSISDYVGADGEPGWFQFRHRAYGREGQPCFRCRAKIRRTIVAGRSSYFCPRCQPVPRRQTSRKVPNRKKNPAAAKAATAENRAQRKPTSRLETKSPTALTAASVPKAIPC
jgi:formamidopyrimidine-DNA glycosylase